jgi:hypothetical protein
MRLAAMIRGGFYGCAPEVVEMVGRLITYQDGAILDPCAGEGEALDVLAQTLGVPRDRVYAIELERDRCAATKARLEGAHVMDACSFFDARVNLGSFSVSWVNPPFDDNVHGGRAEVDFLMRSTGLLVAGGLICLVVPERVVMREYQPIPMYLVEHYEQLAVLTFPEEHRPFNEVVVIGVKRKNHVPVGDDAWECEVKHLLLEGCTLKWAAPAKAASPRTFEKGGLTDEELREALALSPLWNMTDLPEVRKTARPPLPLGRGHLALLLASGQLDGVVEPSGEPSHVVRGVALKVQCPPDVTEEVQENGAMKTTTVIRERIQLVVRAVGQDGIIRTFQ